MLFLVLLLGSLLAACGGAEKETIAPTTEQEKATPAAIEGKALLQERCTRCHDVGRVEQARKTKEEWKATVERMVGKGAQLSQAEQEQVIQYLTETYPK
jgi:cytochrome c5